MQADDDASLSSHGKYVALSYTTYKHLKHVIMHPNLPTFLYFFLLAWTISMILSTIEGSESCENAG